MMIRCKNLTLLFQIYPKVLQAVTQSQLIRCSVYGRHHLSEANTNSKLPAPSNPALHSPCKPDGRTTVKSWHPFSPSASPVPSCLVQISSSRFAVWHVRLYRANGKFPFEWSGWPCRNWAYFIHTHCWTSLPFTAPLCSGFKAQDVLSSPALCPSIRWRPQASLLLSFH